MAVGETSGQTTPRQVVSSTAARRQEAAEEAAAAPAPEAERAESPTEGAEPEPLVKEADPELERLIAEEEEIERTLRDQHEAPHFRQQDAD